MRAAIVQRLDAPPDQIELTVAVDVVAAAEGFVAHLAMGDEQRELSSASCTELADAIAVVVARAAADARVSTPVVTPAVPTIVPPVIVAPVVRSVAVADAAPRSRAWNAAVRVAALAGTGVSPDLDVAGELAVWASYRDFGLELAGSRWAATTAELGAMSGVEVGLSA